VIKKNAYKNTELQIVIEDHKMLVRKIAASYIAKFSYILTLEDLVQSGMIGLIEAVRSYDSDKGASFATYASIRIKGSIIDELRRCDWSPRSLSQQTRQVKEAINIIEHRKGSPALATEVAKELNLSLEEYFKLIERINTKKIYQEDYSSIDLFQSTKETSTSSQIEAVQRNELSKIMAEHICKLADRERKVLLMYYKEGLSFKEISSILDLSESRISQIHSHSVVKLKSNITNKYDNFSWN